MGVGVAVGRELGRVAVLFALALQGGAAVGVAGPVALGGVERTHTQGDTS